jgi:hypothetical protein
MRAAMHCVRCLAERQTHRQTADSDRSDADGGSAATGSGDHGGVGTRQTSKVTAVASATVKALAENALHLVFGLAAAADDGLQSLQAAVADRRDAASGAADGGGMQQWVRLLCLTHRSEELRRGVCQSLFNACANLWYILAAPDAEPEGRDRRHALLDYVCRSVASSAHPGFAAALRALDSVKGGRSVGIPLVASRGGASARAAQIYTLVAALQALRSAPELIFQRQQLSAAAVPAAGTRPGGHFDSPPGQPAPTSFRHLWAMKSLAISAFECRAPAFAIFSLWSASLAAMPASGSFAPSALCPSALSQSIPIALRWSWADLSASSVNRKDSSRICEAPLTRASESGSAKRIRSYLVFVRSRNARPSLTCAVTRLSW